MIRVTVYTTDRCTYCDAAKRLLDSLDVAYDEIRLDDDVQRRYRMAEELGWRTVPMIFLGDEFVGGFIQLRDLHRRGELLPRLETEPTPARR